MLLLSALTCVVSVHAFDASAWKVHFGNLHSHSGVSDGIESPATAYRWAKEEGKLQFLCLSEHNHMVSSAEMNEVDQAADQETASTFVALAGQEYSTISGGNHINLHDVVEPVPEAMNNNYRQLFQHWLPDYASRNPSRIVVAQFNGSSTFSVDGREWGF